MPSPDYNFRPFSVDRFHIQTCFGMSTVFIMTVVGARAVDGRQNPSMVWGGKRTLHAWATLRVQSSGPQASRLEICTSNTPADGMPAEFSK